MYLLIKRIPKTIAERKHVHVYQSDFPLCYAELE